MIIKGKFLCSNNCILCPYEKEDSFSDLEEIGEINQKEVIFSCGEFLLRKDAFKILKFISKKKSIILYSNARVFSDGEIVQKIKDEDINIINVALFGFDKISHEGITRTPHSFNETIKGIENLCRSGIKVNIDAVVSTLIINDLWRIVKLVKNININSLKFYLPYSREGASSLIPELEEYSKKTLISAKKAWKIPIRSVIMDSPPCVLKTSSKCIVPDIKYNSRIKYCGAISSFSMFAPQCSICTLKNKCNGISPQYNIKNVSIIIKPFEKREFRAEYIKNFFPKLREKNHQIEAFEKEIIHHFLMRKNKSLFDLEFSMDYRNSVCVSRYRYVYSSSEVKGGILKGFKNFIIKSFSVFKPFSILFFDKFSGDYKQILLGIDKDLNENLKLKLYFRLKEMQEIRKKYLGEYFSSNFPLEHRFLDMIGIDFYENKEEGLKLYFRIKKLSLHNFYKICGENKFIKGCEKIFNLENLYDTLLVFVIDGYPKFKESHINLYKNGIDFAGLKMIGEYVNLKEIDEFINFSKKLHLFPSILSFSEGNEGYRLKIYYHLKENTLNILKKEKDEI